MYYFYANIILTILSYQCLRIRAFQPSVGEYQTKISNKSDIYDENNYCIWPPDQGIHDMPIALTSDSHEDSIIIPDHTGRMVIKRNNFFKLSCGTGVFAPAAFKLNREINVKCLKRDSFEYDGKSFTSMQIKCQEVKYIKHRKDRTPIITDEHIQMASQIDFPDCVLWVPFDSYRMPIPFTSESPSITPQIINPDIDGNIVLGHNETIQLSCCKSGRFTSYIPTNDTEITVRCLNRTYLEYNGNPYEFYKIKCTEILKPNLRVTNTSCQTRNGIVIEAGCESISTFLLSYRICYDVRFKNTVYTWYNIQSPYYIRRQLVKLKPEFKNGTTQIGVDVNKVYKMQKRLVERVLGAKKLVKNYIQLDKEFLTRGDLIARTEFNYIFEQSATFFYENTVPQWYTFNIGVWRDLKKFFRKKLSVGTSRHLIIAGTHGTCTVTGKQGADRPFYLVLPDSMKVPLFVWKMDYNIDKHTAIVFIGMNNPYKKIDKSSYFCETVPCPKKMKLSTVSKRALLYCCTKKSFEKTYGRLDNVVYRDYR